MSISATTLPRGQIDPAARIIRIFAKVGRAHDVRRPGPARFAARRKAA